MARISNRRFKKVIAGDWRNNTISQLKGLAWDEFSWYIRTRDCIRTTGCASWGLCITCFKRYHIKLLQAGHFIAGRRGSILFNTKGCHAQCYNCNINLKGSTLEYRRQIIKLYGDAMPEHLEWQNKQECKRSKEEMMNILKQYKELNNELNNEKEVE